jgi:ubiquinone biosynthesis protein COQ4
MDHPTSTVTIESESDIERNLLSAEARMGERVPLPGPNDDVRPAMALSPEGQRYFQGDTLPVTSSVLISNSKYLNNPYYREAFATQALRRHGPDLPPTYMVPIMFKAVDEVVDYKRIEYLLAEEKKKYPEFGEWIDRRKFIHYERDDMAKYAPGTLGAEIYDFLGIPGMDMNLGSGPQSAQTDMEFFKIGRSQGPRHDIEHMVTGFGPNTAGENAISMVNVLCQSRFFTPELATYMNMGLVFITATGYSRTAHHYQHALPTYLDAMHQGIEMGLAFKKPIFMIDWDHYLDWQLDDIAADLGIKRGPGKDWDWTTEAATG